VLLFQDLFLCTPGAAALLTFQLFNPLFFRTDHPGLHPFNPVQKEAPRQKAVQGLGTFLLAFDGKPRGHMQELDAGGCFVDFLTAGT
jgi:hypothetical protein